VFCDAGVGWASCLIAPIWGEHFFCLFARTIFVLIVGACTVNKQFYGPICGLGQRAWVVINLTGIKLDSTIAYARRKLFVIAHEITRVAIMLPSFYFLILQQKFFS
jgi:hypothetical protein